MRRTLQALCESFIENRNVIKSMFKWEDSYIYPVCAAIYTDKRQRANEERLVRARELLKEKTGIFSNFRGTAKLVTITMLAASTSPDNKLELALRVYALLKERFFSSEYHTVLAMIIADIAEPSDFERITARTRSIYELMKKEHPFLTGGEDSVFAGLLALSPLSDEQIVRETEECYTQLKPKFHSGNAVQSLSHVLALGDGATELKCSRTAELYDTLKQRGHKYGVSYELATLGVLALLPSDITSLAEDIIEADDWLASQKGYGFFGIDAKQRRMHAGMLVTSDLMNGEGGPAMSSAAIGAAISLIAAQQAAMCAAIAASSAAAASSASS